MSDLQVPDATEMQVWFTAMEAPARPQCIWTVPSADPRVPGAQCKLESATRVIIGVRPDGCQPACSCVHALCFEHGKMLMTHWNYACQTRPSMMFRCGVCGQAGGVITGMIPLWL